MHPNSIKGSRLRLGFSQSQVMTCIRFSCTLIEPEGPVHANKSPQMAAACAEMRPRLILKPLACCNTCQLQCIPTSLMLSISLHNSWWILIPLTGVVSDVFISISKEWGTYSDFQNCFNVLHFLNVCQITLEQEQTRPKCRLMNGIIWSVISIKKRII